MERHFAALSLPDPASDPKITRAISFSELPSTRRILIEQCYQADDSSSLVRQYSCEQVFDKRSNSREVKVSEIVRTGSERCLSNTWTTKLPIPISKGNADWHRSNFDKKPRVLEPETSRKMEPMEVVEVNAKMPEKRAPKKLKNLPTMELNGMRFPEIEDSRRLIRASTLGSSQMVESNNFNKTPVRSRSASPKRMANRSIKVEPQYFEHPKTTEPARCEYHESKKRMRSLVPNVTTNSENSSSGCYKYIFFFLLSISAAILAICFCSEDLQRVDHLKNINIQNMSVELRERIYGQEIAVDRLIYEFKKSSTHKNFITLIGGTGVGKSYAVGIIAKYFSSHGYVFEYFSPIRKTIHEVFTNLSRRQCNLVILENLLQSDFTDVVKFVKFLREHTKNLCVYTIAVYNPQETGDDLHQNSFDLAETVREISSFLHDNELWDATVIAFDELKVKSLEACIKQAADEKKIHLPDERLMEIRDYLLTSGSGCKGAFAKVQLLIES
ncbi:uncharacterized protein [Venturia canescens]|uniref:uncharacterized protein n=1 Tax=Venturia canescens TaxID=32260 RepID=UPI001C9BC8F1|nr:uncharacterized protein LOC122417301 [Venturia canescens]